MAIYPVPSDRKVWLEMRNENIGASEVSALLGVQANFQSSPMALHMIKSGKMQRPDNDNARTRSGRAFEEGVAQRAAEEEGWTLDGALFAVDDAVKVEVNGKIKGSSATLDRVILASEALAAAGFKGPGALECKYVEWDQREHWEGNEPPVWYQIQLQDQLVCADYLWGAIAAKIGSVFIIRKYLRHDTIIEFIRKGVTEFWEGVRDEHMPRADQYDSTSEALRALYPRPIPNTVIDLTGDNELPELCFNAERQAQIRLAAEKEEKRLKNLIREKIGPNEVALIAGGGRVKRSVGKDNEGRIAKPGEIIGARKGSDTLHLSLPKSTEMEAA